MAQAFFGGVHPNDMKAATNEKAIEQLAAPAEVVIPMSMHIGAPCKPIVAVGDKVTIGQKIGEPGGFVSAPIHASVSGTVKAVEPRPFSMGGTMMSVVIENDFQNTVCPDIHPVDDPDSLTPEQLVEIVKNAGIVGQGGATFPTHVKISSGLGKVDYVIINAAECEPYLTADHRLLLEKGDQVLQGVQMMARLLRVERAVLVVAGDKLNAVEFLERRLRRKKRAVELLTIQTRYPLGMEKQLIRTVDGVDYQRIPIKTHLITKADRMEDVVLQYAGDKMQEGDILFISEKAVACTQSRAIPMEDIKPRKLAVTLSRYVTKTPAGIGLGIPETMEMALQECGTLRILFAAFCSVIGKLFHQRGWFYIVAGPKARGIDGPTEGTIPPYDHYVVLTPDDPNGTARKLDTALGHPVAIVDINDLGANILGFSQKEPTMDQLAKVLGDNPLGQSSESTPMGIIRKC